MKLEARRELGKQNETEFGLQEAVMVAARQLGEQETSSCGCFGVRKQEARLADASGTCTCQVFSTEYRMPVKTTLHCANPVCTLLML